jgi:uncharacterized membrane protein HdeD (DUF308 family)
MTAANVDEFSSDVRSAIRRHWVLFLIPGLVMTILGLLAAALPFVTTLVVETFAGWLFLTGGFVGLAALFTTRSMPGFVWTVLSAVLAILIGAFLVWLPFAGVVTLTLALAAFFAAQGIAQILTSLYHRRLFAQSWLWMAVSGIADLILAGIIIAGWPGSVAWALGLLIGINLFMSGLALVMTAIACRSVDHTPGPAEQSVSAARRGAEIA